MTARLPKDPKLAARVHIHVPQKWLRAIDRAAKHLNLTRANFMSTASHAAALKALTEAVK